MCNIQKCFRTFISRCLLYGTAFHLWSTFVLVRFDDDTDDADSPIAIPPAAPAGVSPRQSPRESGEAAGKEGESEDTLFIPLAWSRLQKGDLYTASDPEWQEFVKLSKNRKKLQQLRGENLISSNLKYLDLQV